MTTRPVTTASRALRYLRAAAAVAPARPAYAAGVRGALVVVVPLAAGTMLGLRDALWVGIAGYNVVLADRGGAYRVRARTLAATTCASAVLAAVATFAGGTLVLAVPLAFAVAAGAGLARVGGATGASAGLPVLLTFLAALAFPTTDLRGSAALERGGLILLGGGLAMALTLALWPLRPDRPVRRAVALCYRELAEYVAEIGRRIAAGESLGADRLAGHAAAVRRAVEQTRGFLARTRRGRPGETTRGAQLLQLYEIADRLFVYGDAIADTLETVAPSDRDAAANAALTTLLGDVAAALLAVGDATETERSEDPIPVAWSGAALRTAVAADANSPRSEEVHYAHVGVLLDRMAQLAEDAAATAAGLEGARDVATNRGEPDRIGRESVAGVPAMLRAVLNPDSLLLRYSLRLGLVTALAVTLTALVDLPYGYWITLTAVVILQPYTGATTQRAIQRILGTVLGGVVAAALSALFHDPAAILALIAFFVAMCIALLPLSYAAFSVFVTPAFVLLVDVGVGDWRLAGVRVLNTVLGGVLALLASRALWPEAEWSRLPAHLAYALRACQTYLRTVAATLTAAPDAGDEPPLREARRKIGLAAINAEESFQRLLGEYRGSPARLEPAMALLAYIRHFANSVAALALTRHSPGPRSAEAVTEVTEMADAVLGELATALVEGRPPPPLPERPDSGSSAAAPLFRTSLDRLERQLEVLHHSVTQWTMEETVPRERTARIEKPRPRHGV